MAKRQLITDFNLGLTMPFGRFKGRKIVDCYKGNSVYFNGLIGEALAAGFPEVDRLLSQIKRRVARYKEQSILHPFQPIVEAPDTIRPRLNQLERARLAGRRDEVRDLAIELRDKGYGLRFSWLGDVPVEWKIHNTLNIRKLFEPNMPTNTIPPVGVVVPKNPKEDK